MCAKDDLIRRKSPLRLAGELATAESLQQIKCTLGDVNSLFTDARLYNLHTRLLFQLGCNTDYPVRVYYKLYSRDYTLLARFIPTTKIRNPLLKTLENAAKSRILLACANRRIRQCYLTIYAILANYKEQVLLTSIKKNRYCMRYTKHYNFNIHVSLATDILHLLLKGLVMKMLDFMQDMLDDIYPTVVSLLFILKAPFALHFIRVVYNLVTLAQYKSHNKDTLAYIQGHALTYIIQDIRMYRALDSICTRANSEAYYITIPYSTKLPLSEVAINIAISNFIHAAAILQAFKFYDLSTIIRLVHLVLRDLPNLITRTTMSYYVNNYIN
ncbi:hypothetical protein HBH75_219760 [Parastagonospora nodorum]|nr:hypothetical protein HBH75_219760 [Parastagonospora nodorum]